MLLDQSHFAQEAYINRGDVISSSHMQNRMLGCPSESQLLIPLPQPSPPSINIIQTSSTTTSTRIADSEKDTHRKSFEGEQVRELPIVTVLLHIVTDSATETMTIENYDRP